MEGRVSTPETRATCGIMGYILVKSCLDNTSLALLWPLLFQHKRSVIYMMCQ